MSWMVLAKRADSGYNTNNMIGAAQYQWINWIVPTALVIGGFVQAAFPQLSVNSGNTTPEKAVLEKRKVRNFGILQLVCGVLLVIISILQKIYKK